MKRILATVAALVFVSCASPRNSLNTSASACFRGLPAAAAAVDHDAKLVGVRSVRRSELLRKVAEAERVPSDSLCLVAYRGPFAAGDVPGADPAGPGAYAVVALDARSAAVLATFVLDELPVRFHHIV